MSVNKLTTEPVQLQNIIVYISLILLHLYQASRKRDIGKRYRLRSDATERGVWSGSALFALTTGISMINNKTEKLTRQPLSWKGTAPKRQIEESTGRKRIILYQFWYFQIWNELMRKAKTAFCTVRSGPSLFQFNDESTHDHCCYNYHRTIVRSLVKIVEYLNVQKNHHGSRIRIRKYSIQVVTTRHENIPI